MKESRANNEKILARIENAEWRPTQASDTNEEQTRERERERRSTKKEKTRMKNEQSWTMTKANIVEQRKNYNENGVWSKQDTNEPDEEI